MKYAWIEGHSHSQSIARLCRVLGVSRTGFLQWRIREPSERDQANHALDARVAIIHAESKRSYGRIRITRRLHQQGIAVGHERVRKSLCRQHLRSVYRRKYRVTTDSAHSKPVAANLLARRFDGWSLNRAWTADITYLATDEGWLYLAAILDLLAHGHAEHDSQTTDEVLLLIAIEDEGMDHLHRGLSRVKI